MPSLPRKLLLFMGYFVLFFPALLWCYPQILPAYQHAVLWLGDAVWGLIGVLEIALREDTVAYRWWDGVTLNTTTEGGIDDLFYLNIALLPALLLATPVGVRERLRLLWQGILLLTVFHVVAALGMAYSLRCAALASDSGLCRGISHNLKIGGQLSSAIFWGILTWRYWRVVPITRVPATNPRKRS